MHAALLANTDWLDDELTTFQQLTVGLIDEQVKLTRVMPVQVGGRGIGLSDSPLLGAKLTWNETKLAPLNHRRLVKLSERLDAAGADLIHALHSDLWLPAMVIGDQLDLPVVLGANAMEDVRQAGRLVGQINPTRTVIAATTEPIAEVIRQRTQGTLRVEAIPPGVHVSGATVTERPPAGETPCFAVCGDGKMDEAYGSLIEGMRLLVESRPEVLFFLDGQRTDQHQVWKAAQKAGLLGNVSMTPRRLGHREMLLMADALVHPQPLGRSRGVVLLAMAHAMPVLATEDAGLDYLIDGETAWTLAEPDAEGWAALLERRITEPDEAAALGQRARAWVGEHRLAASQIQRTIKLYHEMCGTPLPFPG